MYLGRIVEIGPAATLIAEPQHPYTRALLNAVPSVDPHRRRAGTLLQGETPNPAAVPPGCRFHPRCPLADAGCAMTDPHREAKYGREVACLKV
jgi:oligopeptide/dipeptide ABC transporter ATP-binding protein